MLFRSSIRSVKSNATDSIISGNRGTNESEQPIPSITRPAHIARIDGSNISNTPDGPVSKKPSENSPKPMIKHIRL